LSKSQVLKNAVIEGDAETVKKETSVALKAGTPAKTVLADLIAGMNVVAQKFDDAEFYLPQVMVAADAMITGINILEPELRKSGTTAKVGTAVVGTVEGDIHDIGKTLVAIMLRGAGFEVYDLGRDVPIERYWEVAKEKDANIIGVSALMSTTTLLQRRVVDEGKEEGLYPKVKVLVGGACTTPEWAAKIGAHYAENASEAMKAARKMMGE